MKSTALRRQGRNLFYTLFAIAAMSQTSACKPVQPESKSTGNPGDSLHSGLPKSDMITMARAYRIALFGDSLANAVVAQTRLGADHMTPEDVQRLMSLMFTGFSAGDDPEGEGALNEIKMERADNWFARKELSAFQGERDWALPARLKTRLNRPVEVFNVARSGSTYRQGISRLEALKKMYRNAPNHDPADLVIVELGGIDFFINDTADIFERNVKAVLGTIARSHPNANIFVVEIPDIVSLMTLPDRVTLKPLGQGQLGITCHQLMSMGGVGAKTGLKPGANEVQSAPQRRRWAQMNLALRNMVEQLNTKGMQLGYNGRAAIGSFDIKKAGALDLDSLLAFDCFHLSEKGQKAFADALWPSLNTLLASP